LKELAGSVNKFMQHRYEIYDIVIEAIDEVLPKKVIAGLSPFAEVKVVDEGQQAVFKRGVGKQRAKKFLTQVGISGVYETFRLDTESFTVKAHAVGGGATVDYQRMIDGAESLTEVMEVINEGLTDAVFFEVQKALKAAYSSGKFPDANLKTGSSFSATDMVDLITVVKAYGEGAVIFATPAFIGTMGPDAIVPPTAAVAGVYHPEDIDAIHKTGYIKIFRGSPVVEIPQSFVDENNEKCWIDDQYAYVLPTGRQKVVKVVLEGATQMSDFKNRDNSLEVYAWKKMGAAILTYHDWGIYQNTSLAGHDENPYGF
jgi:hypothetical protein